MSSKNHFFFSYTGNKREEFDKIYKNIKEDIENRQINTIIEPFCGSCCISCKLSELYPKRFKYKLNDLDENLINLMKLCKDEVEWNKFVEKINKTVQEIDTKEKYLNIINKKDLLGYFIMKKIYNIRCGLYKADYKPQIYNFDNLPIVKFLRNEDIEFSCIDGIDFYKQNKDISTNLLFIDPPYLLSDNSSYEVKKTKLYEYCSYNPINNENGYIIFSLNKNLLVDLLFSKSKKYIEYEKKYKMSLRPIVKHVFISN